MYKVHLFIYLFKKQCDITSFDNLFYELVT